MWPPVWLWGDVTRLALGVEPNGRPREFRTLTQGGCRFLMHAGTGCVANRTAYSVETRGRPREFLTHAHKLLSRSGVAVDIETRGVPREFLMHDQPW